MYWTLSTPSPGVQKRSWKVWRFSEKNAQILFKNALKDVYRVGFDTNYLSYFSYLFPSPQVARWRLRKRCSKSIVVSPIRSSLDTRSQSYSCTVSSVSGGKVTSNSYILKNMSSTDSVVINTKFSNNTVQKPDSADEEFCETCLSLCSCQETALHRDQIFQKRRMAANCSPNTRNIQWRRNAFLSVCSLRLVFQC